MRLLKLALPLLLLSPSAAVEAQPRGPRCGWISNPTPGNFWLRDRAREWLIGAQGGYQAPGMDNIPDLSARQWVRTNGYYGYGCACVHGAVNARSGRFTRIDRVQQLPLSRCRQDRALPRAPR